MQPLQPNTTLQGGKYRIERVLGQGDFGRVLIVSLLIILFPVLVMAQASGGQIRRHSHTQQTERSNVNRQRTANQHNRDNVQPKRSLPTGKVNGYDAIDLGLSVRWASCNVGASTPEEYGSLFAYGDPTGKKYTQNISDYPERINIVNTDSDMAKMLWGNGWRLPTKEEFVELKEKCIWQYVETNDLQGYRVIGLNGESIFFPFAGYTIDGIHRREATEIYKVNNYGHYWSGESGGTYAYTLNLYCSYIEISHDKYVYYGQSVRPVTK